MALICCGRWGCGGSVSAAAWQCRRRVSVGPAVGLELANHGACWLCCCCLDCCLPVRWLFRCCFGPLHRRYYLVGVKMTCRLLAGIGPGAGAHPCSSVLIGAPFHPAPGRSDESLWCGISVGCLRCVSGYWSFQGCVQVGKGQGRLHAWYQTGQQAAACYMAGSASAVS